ADPIVFGTPPARVRAALAGRRVRAARRHGKHLWLELDRGPALLMHFGMTGGLHVPQRPALRLMSTRGARPVGWPPRFAKLRLTFADGSELALADGRRLGRLRLRERPRAEPPLALLRRRWDHDPLARTARGDRLRWETIGGRTTAWAPAAQH